MDLQDATQPKKLVVFGNGIVFDAVKGILTRGNIVIELQEKSSQILLQLLENQNEIVKRSDIGNRHFPGCMDTTKESQTSTHLSALSRALETLIDTDTEIHRMRSIGARLRTPRVLLIDTDETALEAVLEKIKAYPNEEVLDLGKDTIFDIRKGELLGNAGERHLQPKTARVLTCLWENRGAKLDYVAGYLYPDDDTPESRRKLVKALTTLSSAFKAVRGSDHGADIIQIVAPVPGSEEVAMRPVPAP